MAGFRSALKQDINDISIGATAYFDIPSESNLNQTPKSVLYFFINMNSINGGNFDAGIYYKNGYWYAFRYGLMEGLSSWKEQRLNESRTGKRVKIEMKFLREDGFNKVMLFIDGYRIASVSNTKKVWQVDDFINSKSLYAKYEANIVTDGNEMDLFSDKNSKGYAFFKNAVVSGAMITLLNGGTVTPLSHSHIVSSDQGNTSIANQITILTNKTRNGFTSTIDLNRK